MSDSMYTVNKIELEKSEQQKQQEFRDNLEMIKIERRKYMQKKNILYAVSKCLHEDTDLDEELKHKIQNIMLEEEIKPCMTLVTKDSEEEILGLSSFNDNKLSFNEQEKLGQCVIKKLKSLQEHFSSDHRNIDPHNEEESFHLKAQDKVLAEYIKKLNSLQETYMKNLQIMYDLQKELLQLRMNDVQEVVTDKINEYSIKSKMYSLRSKMISEKSRIDIFNETSVSGTAYKELLNDILEQQKTCEKEIDELKLSKEKYKFVSCKEYDEILKLYLQYKSSIQKRETLHKQIKEI